MTNGPATFNAPPPNPPPPPGCWTGQPAPNGLVASHCGFWPVAGAPVRGSAAAVVDCVVEGEAPRAAAGGGAGAGCTRKSQQAIWMPCLLLLASVGAPISRISWPVASVIFSFTSPTAFLLYQEITAAGGGFSP